jgi:hypothetical protein
LAPAAFFFEAFFLGVLLAEDLAADGFFFAVFLLAGDFAEAVTDFVSPGFQVLRASLASLTTSAMSASLNTP